VRAAGRAALLELAAQRGWAAADVQIAPLPARLSARNTARCAGGWQVQVREPVSLSRLRVAARCTSGGGEDFVLRASLNAEVLVAARAIASGSAVSAADVETQRRDIGLAEDAIGRVEDLAGRSPRMSLKAGELLRERQFVAALLVHRGDKVRILAGQDAVAVEAPGEALESGAVGAMVKVRNRMSGRTVTARVLEAGVVQVP